MKIKLVFASFLAGVKPGKLLGIHPGIETQSGNESSNNGQFVFPAVSNQLRSIA